MLAIGLNLDGADGLVSEQRVGKYPSASPRKKVESSESVQLIGVLIVHWLLVFLEMTPIRKG